jgi:hypothetical protein
LILRTEEKKKEMERGGEERGVRKKKKWEARVHLEIFIQLCVFQKHL